jgi:hypothetical protein
MFNFKNNHLNKYNNLAISINTKKNIKYFIEYKINELKINNYNPNENNIKYLVLFACHCNSEIKYKTIINNLKYLIFDCVDIALINSYDLPYNDKIKEKCEELNIKYFENENMKSLDFGKWNYLLNKIDYNNYEHIVFINDSFIIKGSINHSIELNYHYQSYLFSIKKNSIIKIINKYNDKLNYVKTYNDVINYYEIRMVEWFNQTSCFLNMSNFNNSILNNKNIFFQNDFLYLTLYNNGLLPFIKIKRIHRL